METFVGLVINGVEYKSQEVVRITDVHLLFNCGSEYVTVYQSIKSHLGGTDVTFN